jgi:hypothetical protein
MASLTTAKFDCLALANDHVWSSCLTTWARKSGSTGDAD